MRKISKKNKRILLISSFLALFTLGTVLILIIPINVKITYNQTIYTEDGIAISFNVLEPAGRESELNKRAVIIAIKKYSLR